ncbi:MAG TPA: hypothetical protein VK464_25045 [Symbiobacteriaceae bacterium]|jgi:hypothetical protein|nr:hypothetical protein [Symbiobacteriaceae bacterium]
MHFPTLESGRVYRITRNLEIRDEKTGTLKTHYLKGTELTLRKVAEDEDRVWLEGCAWPVPLSSLRRMVEPAGEAQV